MNINEIKKIVVVIGPGRSGTSAITRGLKVFGVDLGVNLMLPEPGINDKGFWEDLDIYLLNKDIFKEIGHDWHKLTPVDFNILPKEKLIELKLRAIKLIREKIKKTSLFGMKDPQITRLLPFWRGVFAHLSLKDSYVIACRNPMSVARSLSKYTGFPLEKSYLLWFEHTLASLVGSAGASRVVVSYDLLMQDPLAQLQRIGRALEFHIDAHGDEFLEYSSQFLDAGLRHDNFQTDELSLDGDIPSKCIMLYDLILKFATDTTKIDSLEALEEVKRLQSIHHEEFFLLKCVQDLEDKLSAVHAKFSERGENFVRLNHVVSERDEQINNLMQTVESLILDRDAHKAGFQQQQVAFAALSKERDEQFVRLNHMVLERDGQIKNLMQTVESLILDRDAHKAAAGVLQLRIGDLVRVHREQVEDLNRVVAGIKSELGNLYSSKSWRITAPLRYLARAFLRIGNRRPNNAFMSVIPETTYPQGIQSDSVPLTEIPAASVEDGFGRTEKHRVLLVSYYCPTRAHAGGLRILDIYTLIKQRCPDVQLDLLTHHRPAIDWSISDVYQIFDNVYLSPVEDLSLSVLQELVPDNELYYDAVDLQFHPAAAHLDQFKRITSKVLFTPMESQAKVLYLELRNQIKKNHRIGLRGLLAQFKVACEEVSFCRKADMVVCVSRTDAAFIRAVGGGRQIRGIDTGISSFEFADALNDGFSQVPARERPKVVIYVAYFGSETNVIALRWYLQKVHPFVAEAVPDYKLVVVGRGDLSSFESYRGSRVELVGEVPALAPYINSAKIGIAPAFGGSGFRGKINQYAVLGIPSVVTSIALKGLDYRNGETVFVADNSQDFADRCIRLLTNDELNDHMANGARQLCLKRYSWASKWPEISAAYDLKEQDSC